MRGQIDPILKHKVEQTRTAMADLLEMWQAHNTINLYLLKHLPEGGLSVAPALGGFNVAQEFAHMSDLRFRWIAETAPHLVLYGLWFEQQPQLEISQTQLETALEASGASVEALIRECVQDSRGITGFPGSVASFLAYLIAHESYHWGEIGAVLTQAGKPLDRDVALGIWRGWWEREVAA